MRILIIRHGDPDYEHDCLTEKGKREAMLLAEKLKKEKIDYFYSSPMGRAKETCLFTAKAMGREQEIVTLNWLREFDCSVRFPSGRTHHIAWDMLPEEWTGENEFYHPKTWYEHPCYEGSKLKEKYFSTAENLDALICKHGYKREGEIYRAERANKDTVAIFCHFGLESVLLSRLCNISTVSLWHHFVAAPTSVTTLYTEERRKGKAVFRCAGFGDIGHLYVGGEEPSFSARFCETFEDDTRHD